MKRHVMFVGLLVFAFAALAPARAENDPRVGTWKLNPAKSKSSNGQMPASETRTYEAQGSMIMATTEGVDAKGKAVSNHYDATADGKDHPSGGPNSKATIAIKETSPGKYAGTVKREGKVVVTNTAVISGGGKVFTFMNKGTDPEGKPFTSTMVYEKQ